MPVSDSSIIDPGQVPSKAPLKKATVAWMLGIVSALILAGYYIPKLTQSGKKEAVEETATQTTKQTGTSSQIDNELATVKPVVATPPTNAASGAVAPMPLPTDPGDDGQSPPKGGHRSDGPNTPSQLEMDASARTSRVVVVDSADTESVAAAAAGVNQTRRQLLLDSAAQSLPKPETVTDKDPQAPIVDVLRAQLAAQKQRDPNRDWMAEFKDLLPAKTLTPRVVKSRYTLIQGKVIPAVLGKALNSDLPGDITAFTTMDIYDSLTSEYLLIPKGSMLMGEYANGARSGQSRIMFAFSRIVLPNGLTFDLPGNKGQDQTGASGIPGNVDNHYFARFTSAFLIAIIADRADRSTTQQNVNINSSGPSTAAGKVLSDIATADLGRNSGIGATLTVPEGSRINVQVAGDMEFPGPYSKSR